MCKTPWTENKYRTGDLSNFKNSCLYNFVQMRYRITFLIDNYTEYLSWHSLIYCLSAPNPFLLATYCIIGIVPTHPPHIFLWYLAQCLSLDGIKRGLEGKVEGLLFFSPPGSSVFYFSCLWWSVVWEPALGPCLQQDSPVSQWAAPLLVVCGRPKGASPPSEFHITAK